MSYSDVMGVIIDPGHGGRDGGASSKSGILEKDLNLYVSNALNDVLKLCGIKTVMTRDTDSLVCDENDANIKGKIKATDLKNRLAFSKEYPEYIFVSIHMNNFSVEKYNGLQVYYSPNNENSITLAKSIQDNVSMLLQKNNDRKVKAAGSNIYILNRIEIPAVLVECGFLSNINEAQKLSEPTYRGQLSLIIADSILSNLSLNRE